MSESTVNNQLWVRERSLQLSAGRVGGRACALGQRGLEWNVAGQQPLDLPSLGFPIC